MNKFGAVCFLAVLVLCISMIQVSESKGILKLAAAAAILRGGPIIPLPIRYPVHVPKAKVVHAPVHIPVHHKHVEVAHFDHGHGHGFELGHLGHADAGWW